MTSRERAESVVRHWRFSPKHLDAAGRPSIRLGHYEHIDLVDEIEKAIDAALSEVKEEAGCR